MNAGVASGSILATLPTGQGPREVAISHDRATAVVTDYGSQTGGSTPTVIDVPEKRVARTVSLGVYRRPHGIVFMAGDSIVAVTSETNKFLLLVRIATGEIVKAVPTGQNGSHMVGVTRDGTRGWTGNIGSNKERHRIADKDAGPQGIVFTPDGKYALLSLSTMGRVAIIGVMGRKQVGQLMAGETPDGVAYTAKVFGMK